MTMKETEESIIEDLKVLGDALNRMEYLIECAREDEGIPEEERREEYLIKDCQMKTWVDASFSDNILDMRTDSESLLVKGALSLIKEIYKGRTPREIASFECGLIHSSLFSDMFNETQSKGLVSVISSLRKDAAEHNQTDDK